ncbi:MAG: IPT/TIG domain-containing protein [Cyclobacteriaceae bacterium]
MKAVVNNLMVLFLTGVLYGCKDFEIDLNEYPSIEIDSYDVQPEGVTIIVKSDYRYPDRVQEVGLNLNRTSDYNQWTKITSWTQEGDRMIFSISKDLYPNEEYNVKPFLKTSDSLIVYGDLIQFYSQGSKSPVISKIVPNEGFDGTSVTIIGENFSSLENGNKVQIQSNTAEITFSSSDSIVFTVPSSSYNGYANVRLLATGNEFNMANGFYIYSAEIDSISRREVFPGDTVTLYGKHFQTGASLEINHKDYDFSLTGDSIIKFQAPYISPYLDENVELIYKKGRKSTTNNDLIIKKSFDKLKEPFASHVSVELAFESFQLNGEIYVLNNLEDQNLYRYDEHTDLWTAVSKFPDTSKFFYQTPIVDGDRVLFLGGVIGENTNDFYNNVLDELGLLKYSRWLWSEQIWEYKPATDTWTRLADAPFGLFDPTYTILNRKLYLLVDKGRIEFWAYDLDNNTFDSLSSVGGYSPTLVTSNEKVTWSAGNGVWQYEEGSDAWRKIHEKGIDIEYDDYTSHFMLDSDLYIFKPGRVYKGNVNKVHRIATLPSYANRPISKEKGYFINNSLYTISIGTSQSEFHRVYNINN